MGLRIIFLAVAGLLLVCTGKGMGDVESVRPSILLSAQDVTRLREELKTVEWKRELYMGNDDVTVLGTRSGVKPSADRWLTRSISVPARSGHVHRFFCESGHRLEFPADNIPQPDGYVCATCDKTYAGERYDGAVRWRAHNQLATGARDLGLVYLLEGDDRYARKAAEILISYTDAYPGPHTALLEGGIMYQSLCEAVWIIPLAAAYDMIYDSGAISLEDKRHIEENLFRPVAEGLITVGIRGNWGSWHLSAVGVVGYAIKDQELIDYGLTKFRVQISDDLGEDGLWPESVHTYHFYPLNAFLHLAEAAWHNGTDLYNWEAQPGKSLRAMFTAPLNYMYPDFRLPAINDGWFESFVPLQQYELTNARLDDPTLGWVLKEGYERRGLDRIGLWSLIHGRSLEEDFAAPEFRSTDFSVLGIAVLRSPGGSMMTFDYGPFLSHGQLDKMGITLFAHDTLLVADYGTPGYGSPVMRWYVSTPAHNTVVVDGRSQERTSDRMFTWHGRGDIFEVMEAQTEEAYPGVLHKRTIIRAGENFLVIDNMSSDTERTYDWFLRCEGELEIPVEAVSEMQMPDYEFIEYQEQYIPDGEWTARWHLDEVGLSLTMLDDDPGIVTSGRCPAENATRTVPLIIVRKTGKEAVFTTALAPFSGTSSVRCSVVSGLIRLEHDDGVDWIFTGDTDDSSPMRTDGRFAMVRTSDSKPIFGSVIGGETVEWDGEICLRNTSGDPWYERHIDGQ